MFFFQSLLSHMGPSEELKGLVLDFLYSAKGNKTNWLSLEVMCSNEAQAIKILIGVSPKALLPYAKGTIGTDEKKVRLFWITLYSVEFIFLYFLFLNYNFSVDSSIFIKI